MFAEEISPTHKSPLKKAGSYFVVMSNEDSCTSVASGRSKVFRFEFFYFA